MDEPSANILGEDLQQNMQPGRMRKHASYETRNVQPGSTWRLSMLRSPRSTGWSLSFWKVPFSRQGIINIIVENGGNVDDEPL
jgi:hypothetical protein